MRSMLTGLGLGAGLMYLFDPIQGRRRRSLLRDQITHTMNAAETYLDKASRDLNNRVRGLSYEVGALASQDVPSDQKLADRVRSKMGRHVSHPGAIEVSVNQGRVIVSGQVLAGEVQGLLSAIQSVRGVEEVENRLETHNSAQNISALQGGTPPRGETPRILRGNLPPGVQLALGTAGLGWVGYMIVRRAPLTFLLGAAGAALAMRNKSQFQARPLLERIQGEPQTLQRTYEIQAPVDRVYEFINNFENYPRFMPRVRRVHELGGERLRWTLSGPAGQDFHFEEVLTERVPNERLSWRAAPEAPIDYEGTVQLQPAASNATRVEVELTYRPPAGGLGEMVASAIGLDPGRMVDQAFERIATHLEQHQQTERAEQSSPNP